MNLAAVSAALTAGPEAGEDRSRRWIASSTAGVVLVVLGLGSAAFGTLVTAASRAAFLGISPALWALVAGLVVRAALDLGRRRPQVGG
ncbi:benzoate/H(+) symporter BenE family transporter [Klenkia soli]|uniref:benzoate/H(+) symporter BenE family transporter n=1 Tax=Klenkia soli TaxID=1052260 RepID=UPI001A975C93